MKALTRVLNITICLGLAMTVISCGQGKTKSSKTVLTAVPEVPIVISGPAKDQAGQDVAAPWFNFRLSFTNTTDEPITIVAVTVEVTGQNTSGAVETKSVTFGASAFDYTLDTPTLECKFNSFGTWAPGESKEFSLVSGACARYADGVFFYIPGNPVGTSGNNYNYRVKAKPLGWFGSFSLPTDRFEKTTTFTTQ